MNACCATFGMPFCYEATREEHLCCQACGFWDAVDRLEADSGVCKWSCSASAAKVRSQCELERGHESGTQHSGQRARDCIAGPIASPRFRCKSTIDFHICHVLALYWPTPEAVVSKGSVAWCGISLKLIEERNLAIRSELRSGLCHAAATRLTIPASLDAFFHQVIPLPQGFAAGSTRLAHVGAQPAIFRVELASMQHEVSGCQACLGTIGKCALMVQPCMRASLS
jgi:hypothetical protein